MNKLPAYLRAFDAALAGTTVREIAGILFPRDVDDEARQKSEAGGRERQGFGQRRIQDSSDRHKSDINYPP